MNQTDDQQAEKPKVLPHRKYPIIRVDVLRRDGVPTRSEFPHPLVTLDYDSDGNLINVSVLGDDLRVETETSDPLHLLPGNPHLKLDRDAYIRGDNDPFVRPDEAD